MERGEERHGQRPEGLLCHRHGTGQPTRFLSSHLKLARMSALGMQCRLGQQRETLIHSYRGKRRSSVLGRRLTAFHNQVPADCDVLPSPSLSWFEVLDVSKEVATREAPEK